MNLIYFISWAYESHAAYLYRSLLLLTVLRRVRKPEERLVNSLCPPVPLSVCMHEKSSEPPKGFS
jgi:hypothetical protein